MLGLLGEEITLRGALLDPMVLVFLAVFCTPAAGGRKAQRTHAKRDPESAAAH